MVLNDSMINRMTARQKDKAARRIEQLLSTWHNTERSCVPSVAFDDLLVAHKRLTTRRAR